MSKDTAQPSNGDEMRPNYDFSDGTRGKYADRFATGSNVVVLSPDVADAFPTSEAVNQALRDLLKERQGKESA